MPTNPTWENTVEEVTPEWDDTTDAPPGGGATRDFKTPAQAEKLQRQFLPTAISDDQWAGMSERAARDEQNRLAGNAMNEAGTGLTTALYQELPAAIGTAMHDAGTAIYEGGVAAMQHNIEDIAGLPADTEQDPGLTTDQAIRKYPVPVQAGIRGGEGLIRSLPQMAIAAVNPYAGAMAFGFTPEGFSVKNAAIAAALPFIGSKVGAVVENMAARAGVSSDVALQAFQKIGGAAGAAGAIGADEAYHISQLPEEEQGDAWIAAAGNVGSMFLLGTLGHSERLKNTDKVLSDRASANAETPAAAVAKVQEHVADVVTGKHPLAVEGGKLMEKRKAEAATGRQRAAKVIKTELVQRLEQALEKSKGENPNAKITIDIPGDGKFTIVNTPEAIGQVLTKAKKLDTLSGKEPKKLPTGGSYGLEGEAVKTYGSERKAIQKLRELAANPDIELTPELRQEMIETAADMVTRLPENVAREKVKQLTEALDEQVPRLAEAEARLKAETQERKTLRQEISDRLTAKKPITALNARERAVDRKVGNTFIEVNQIRQGVEAAQKRLGEAKAQAEATARAAAEFAAKNQQDMFGGGINTGALGEMGMGGAKPGEFRNSPTTPTGIRNAIVDGERIKRGLPPAMDAARKDFGTVWDEAMARVDQDPTVTERLVAELQQKPRAASDVENALLLHRQIELQNEYGKLTRDLAQAFDDSASFPNRLADVETFKARVAETSDKLLALYDVGKAVGTEQGRGLASRKMLAFEDYSLAKMEMEKRAAKGGAPLSDAERAQLVTLQERIQRTESEFQAYREKQDAERANRMTDEAIRDMQEELKRRPNYDSRIVKIAEEIVVKLEKQAVSAQQRLKEKFRRTNTGLDPTIIYDLGVMGAAKIARAGLDFAKFSAEMVAELGDGVKPYMQAAWERANLHLENEGAKYGDKAPLVKAALRKRDASGKRENIIEGLKKGAKEGLPVQMEGDYIRQLAEGFVAAGIKTREPLVDAVHEVLTKEVGLEITRRETMDAISGYGKFKPLNPDAVKATLRELRGQMQQVAKLEDIQSRTPLKKTGVERRTVGDEERRLLQQVNEAKRRFGVVVDDPARQLKSALDAIKTRLKNQVADIEYQINTKARIVKTKSASPFDAETKLLELRRDELRAQLDELLPKPGLTPEQQAAQVARGIERSIADYERRIAGKDVTGPDKKRILTTPALEALRARRDALRAEWQELRDVLDPGRRERASLASLKARLAQSTASYMERLAKHDFSKRKRNEPPTLDAEALKLKAENELAKREYHHGLIMDRMANRTTGQRVYAGVKEALNLPRNLLSSWDVSAVLRQGGFIALGNPLRAGRSLAPMFRALASEKAAVMIEQEILSRPNAPLYKQSKLYLAPHEALHLSAMEEAIMSRVAGKIPGLRASNRAYITFLNRLRADSFDSLLASVSRKDGSLTPTEMQAIANYINVATGRGDLGKAAAAAETLATVFFSPRLVASRFQLLAGQPMYRGSFRTRQAIAQEYGKFLAGIGVVLGLGIMAGATVERDPRNSDFGKLKFGNTRLDVLGGLGQVSTLVGRLATGETVNASGEVKPIRGEVPYGSRTGADVIAAFLRSKLSPVVGTGVDILSGKNAVGEPVTPRSVAINMTVPLSFRDIYDVMQDQGMERGTALGVLSLFGFGLQHYEADKSNPVIEAYMRRIRGVTPEQRAAIRKMLEEAVKK